jgi:hypothetical protein
MTTATLNHRRLEAAPYLCAQRSRNEAEAGPGFRSRSRTEPAARACSPANMRTPRRRAGSADRSMTLVPTLPARSPPFRSHGQGAQLGVVAGVHRLHEERSRLVEATRPHAERRELGAGAGPEPDVVNLGARRRAAAGVVSACQHSLGRSAWKRRHAFFGHFWGLRRDEAPAGQHSPDRRHRGHRPQARPRRWRSRWTWIVCGPACRPSSARDSRTATISSSITAGTFVANRTP